jgi:hypothetical protein
MYLVTVEHTVRINLLTIEGRLSYYIMPRSIYSRLYGYGSWWHHLYIYALARKAASQPAS